MDRAGEDDNPSDDDNLHNTEGQHSTTYEARVQLIQAWLARCLHTHGQCNWPEAPTPLPTRVLELNLGDDTPDIRLVNGRDHGQSGQYAALTYCWGPCPTSILKTNATNLHQHQSRVRFGDLNLLFRETVTLLRSLGIPYLWIDALCIIQDDQHDWHNEASRMATVFSNAHLTISASMSTSPDTSLFPDLLGAESEMGFRNIFDDVTWGTLSRRGWCLQERCLSRRIVHFGREQVHWECATATHSEHVLNQEARVLPAPHKLLLGPKGFPNQRDKQGTARERDNYLRWYTIMEDYTGRTLTLESDRVPAMLGLIDAFVKAAGDKMVAGLWSGDLALGLLWYRAQSRRSDYKKEAIQSGIPSWSWFSVPGRVDWPASIHHTRRKEVSIQDFTLDEATKSITLRGKIVRFRPESLDPAVPSIPTFDEDIFWDFSPESLDLVLIRKHEIAQHPQENLQYANLGREYTMEALRILWVLIIVEPRYHDNGNGLMLRETDCPGTYRRVGYADIQDDLGLALEYGAWESGTSAPLGRIPRQTITLR